MVRRQIKWGMVVALVLGSAGQGVAGTILGGVEDWGGGVEKNGDYNDLIFQVSGNIGVIAPGGVFSNLTPDLVNEGGGIFWANPSGDGDDENVGYYMSGMGNEQYLATLSGTSVNVTFFSSGPLTITLLQGISANSSRNILGWYDAGNPAVLHPLFAGGTAGDTAVFDPSSTFGLYSNNGWGQTFASDASANVGAPETDQHFAFFTPQATVPEPSPGVLAAIGLGLVAAGLFGRRRK